MACMLFPEQPDRLRIRHPVMKPEAEEAHERQAVLDLELSRVVRERVQGLEHQDLEHQDRVIGWAATPRSIGTGQRPQQRAPENLELDQLSHLDQRVPCLGKCPIPLIEIEEPRLPHHPRLRIAPHNSITAGPKRGGSSRCPLAAAKVTATAASTLDTGATRGLAPAPNEQWPMLIGLIVAL